MTGFSISQRPDAIPLRIVQARSTRSWRVGLEAPWLATAFGIVRVEIPTDTGPGNLDSLARAIRFTEFPAGYAAQ